MHTPKTHQPRPHAIAATRGHDSGLPLIAGLIGYIALLPVLAFGVCAVSIFT